LEEFIGGNGAVCKHREVVSNVLRLILGPTLISPCRRKSIEVKGLSSTGTAHKTAFDTEAEAYNE
jgi:hypothetical protein